ncbi:MAG: hypothetical protein AAB580_04505 [Patescibacteria group bacterium]
MASETHFCFEETYPGHKYWRGGPDQLANFQDELKIYRSGLETLAQMLAYSNFTKVVTIGYSAANMMTDLLNITNLHSQFPPHIKLIGEIAWKIWSHEAVKTYKQLGASFDGGILLEDFAETARKAKEMNEYLLDPLKIPFNFAFLTATDQSVFRMSFVGINPFVAIEHPSGKLMKLLDMRRSPSSIT